MPESHPHGKVPDKTQSPKVENSNREKVATPAVAASSPNEVKATTQKIQDVPVGKLLTVHNAQDKITIVLYQFRVLVSLGVLGFVYHEREFSYNWIVKSALSFGFILFAIGNGMGAVASQRITFAVSNALRKAATKYGDTSEVLIAHDAITPFRMKIYQIVLTAIVLIAMWFPNISRLVKGLGTD
jgi:hypothetical protein